MIDDILVPVFAIAVLFIALPWLGLHYITKWKQAPRITDEDERLLDELHVFARRLEDRMQTIERIIAADNPDYRSIAAPVSPLGDSTDHRLSRRN